MVRRGESSDNTVLFLDTCIDYVADDTGKHQYTRFGFEMLKKADDKTVPFSTNVETVETVPKDVLSFNPLPDVIRAN
jgi:hypothetical protein